MINLILHTMEKKELLKGLLSILKDMRESIDEGHVFNPNSEECKNCNLFTTCKEFNAIRTAIENSNYSKEDKLDLAAFIAFFKYEYMWSDDLNIEEFINDNDSNIYEINERFENIIKEFRNWDKLVTILDDNQLSLLRKIALDCNQKIIDLIEKVKNNNLKEMNFIINRLHKPEDIGGPRDNKKIPYEEMTREELIEELKKK